MDLSAEQARLKGAARPEERIAPSEVDLIKYRDNRTPLSIKLLTGETVEGAIRWYDERALRLVLPDRSEVTVFLQAIAYLKAEARS